MMSEQTSEKRSEVRILAAILGAVENEPKIQQHILNECNISGAVFKAYRDRLIEQGHLMVVEGGHYMSTRPGQRALAQYRVTLQLMDEKKKESDN